MFKKLLLSGRKLSRHSMSNTICRVLRSILFVTLERPMIWLLTGRCTKSITIFLTREYHRGVQEVRDVAVDQLAWKSNGFLRGVYLITIYGVAKHSCQLLMLFRRVWLSRLARWIAQTPNCIRRFMKPEINLAVLEEIERKINQIEWRTILYFIKILVAIKSRSQTAVHKSEGARARTCTNKRRLNTGWFC